MVRRLGNPAADGIIDRDRIDDEAAAVVIDEDRQGPTRMGNVNANRHRIGRAPVKDAVDDGRHLNFGQHLFLRRPDRAFTHRHGRHYKILHLMGSDKSCHFPFDSTHHKPSFPLLWFLILS